MWLPFQQPSQIGGRLEGVGHVLSLMERKMEGVLVPADGAAALIALGCPLHGFFGGKETYFIKPVILATGICS